MPALVLIAALLLLGGSAPAEAGRMRFVQRVSVPVGTPLLPVTMNYGGPRIGYRWALETLDVNSFGQNTAIAAGPTGVLRVFVGGVEIFAERIQLPTPTGTGAYTVGPFAETFPEGFVVHGGQQITATLDLDNNGGILFIPDRTVGALQVEQRREPRGDFQ